MEKILKLEIVRVCADNGEHSHWRAMDIESGETIWSQNPEEDSAMGVRVHSGFNCVKVELDTISEKWPNCFEILRAFRLEI